MYRFYLVAVDVIPAAMVLIPLMILLHWTAYRRDLRKTMLYGLLALYFAAVISVVGLPNVTYVRIDANVNLIPFRDMLKGLASTVLNILLFFPMGFLLPVLWKNFRCISKTIGVGFTISLVIELLQLLTYRATDINDLMTNTFGTFLGFLLADCLIQRHHAFRNALKEQGTGDVFSLFVLSFLVMFFLHPFLSPLLWDRIL